MSDTEIRKSAGDPPLTGVRVIDVGVLFAGPLVATTLGDLGAEVIKIEHPKGDDLRRIGRQKNNQSLWWSVVGRNKNSISVDISKPNGAEIVRRLARTADVLIENFRPGRFAQWGLEYEKLSAENKGLVMLHVSGYGQSGPYSRRPGLGTLAEAFSGFSFVMGQSDGPPTLPQFPIADEVAAMAGTYAVLAALFARERNGGVGDEIDISLYEPLLSLMGSMVIDYDQLGVIAKRKGNRSHWNVPRNAYRTKDDKWLVVGGAANSVALRAFRAIGRDDMADDPGLATNALRLKRIDECDAAMAKWISEHTLDEALSRFHECEVVAGPVNDVSQLFADPHVNQTGAIVELQDPVLGRVKVQDVVPKFRRNPGRIRWLGRPDIGGDTRAVLEDLGYTKSEIDELETGGVVR